MLEKSVSSTKELFACANVSCLILEQMNNLSFLFNYQKVAGLVKSILFLIESQTLIIMQIPELVARREWKLKEWNTHKYINARKRVSKNYALSIMVLPLQSKFEEKLGLLTGKILQTSSSISTALI